MAKITKTLDFNAQQISTLVLALRRHETRCRELGLDDMAKESADVLSFINRGTYKVDHEAANVA